MPVTLIWPLATGWRSTLSTQTTAWRLTRRRLLDGGGGGSTLLLLGARRVGCRVRRRQRGRQSDGARGIIRWTLRVHSGRAHAEQRSRKQRADDTQYGEHEQRRPHDARQWWSVWLKALAATVHHTPLPPAQLLQPLRSTFGERDLGACKQESQHERSCGDFLTRGHV
jgi:hypothetical protein